MTVARSGKVAMEMERSRQLPGTLWGQGRQGLTIKGKKGEGTQGRLLNLRSEQPSGSWCHLVTEEDWGKKRFKRKSSFILATSIRKLSGDCRKAVENAILEFRRETLETKI